MKEKSKDYEAHINGDITNRKSESDLYNVIFTCFKDDEIRYANEWNESNKIK